MSIYTYEGSTPALFDRCALLAWDVCSPKNHRSLCTARGSDGYSSLKMFLLSGNKTFGFGRPLRALPVDQWEGEMVLKEQKKNACSAFLSC